MTQHDIYINRFTIISLPGVNTSFQFTFFNKIPINEHAFLSTYVFSRYSYHDQCKTCAQTKVKLRKKSSPFTQVRPKLCSFSCAWSRDRCPYNMDVVSYAADKNVKLSRRPISFSPGTHV